MWVVSNNCLDNSQFPSALIYKSYLIEFSISFSFLVRSMESVDLDMGDLFDEEAMDDDDVGAVSALPNLPEYNEEGEGQGSDQGDNEESGRLSYCCLLCPTYWSTMRRERGKA